MISAKMNILQSESESRIRFRGFFTFETSSSESESKSPEDLRFTFHRFLQKFQTMVVGRFQALVRTPDLAILSNIDTKFIKIITQSDTKSEVCVIIF